MISTFLSRLRRRVPDAVSYLRGTVDYPRLRGVCAFFQAERGVYVAVEATGLPVSDGEDEYILELSGDSCVSPTDVSEATELPPLYSVADTVEAVFFTARLHVQSAIDHALILHRVLPDGGDARIACGLVGKP